MILKNMWSDVETDKDLLGFSVYANLIKDVVTNVKVDLRIRECSRCCHVFGVDNVINMCSTNSE